jgi:MFS family permease
VSDYSLTDNIKDAFTVLIERKTFTVIFITVLGYLSWLMAFPLFGPVMTSYLAELRALAIEKGGVMQIFLIAMMVSSFVSGLLIDRLLRRVIFIWVSAIIASALTFMFLWVNDILILFPVVAVLGIVAGISPVSWGAFFADNSSPEDRGRVMGMSVALSMLIAYIFLLMTPSGVASTSGTGIIIAGLLILVTIVTIFLKPQEKTEEIMKARRRRGPGVKQTALYAGPVFLFYIVVGVLLSIVFPTIQDNVSGLIFYLAWGLPFAIGAVIGGILLDTRGRKFPMIIGLAITGGSLAVLALMGIRDGFVSIIPMAIGFALVTVSSFIIWADLAPIHSRGLHYGLGFGLIAGALTVGLFGVGGTFGSVSVNQIRNYILYSGVALFLCIPPLIQAEDALPQEVIERRQMEDHLRRARRMQERR